MFHKKTLITLAVLGLVLTAGIASTYAFEGNGWGQKANLNLEQLEQRQAYQQQFQTAMDNGDYQAWQNLIEEKQALIQDRGFKSQNILEAIDSQEDFEKLVQAHQAMQAGDYQTAREIKNELGLPGLYGKGMGKRMENRKFIDTNGDGVCDNLDIQQ